MFRLLIGIGIGIGLTIFFPDIVPIVKNVFLDSGARDLVVDQLKEIK